MTPTDTSDENCGFIRLPLCLYRDIIFMFLVHGVIRILSCLRNIILHIEALYGYSLLLLGSFYSYNTKTLLVDKAGASAFLRH
jgi:hypothetical protein